jgi:hypothetical protein
MRQLKIAERIKALMLWRFLGFGQPAIDWTLSCSTSVLCAVLIKRTQLMIRLQICSEQHR